jgi:hypothetical protein
MFVYLIYYSVTRPGACEDVILLGQDQFANSMMRIKFIFLLILFDFSNVHLQGDSGGPLIVNYEGRWTLAGITSAGFGCAVDHQPGIYHKVAVTARWIANAIA